MAASSGQIELSTGAAQVRNLSLPSESRGLSKGTKIGLLAAAGALAAALAIAATPGDLNATGTRSADGRAQSP